MTSEICLAAVQQYGGALMYITEELMTPELCLAAVQQDGGVLRYVPRNIKVDIPTFDK
jgi:hypothetical protein